MTNPEADVLADIDALIDEQLASGSPDGDLSFPRCPNCLNDWHGLPSWGCSGSDGALMSSDHSANWGTSPVEWTSRIGLADGAPWLTRHHDPPVAARPVAGLPWVRFYEVDPAPYIEQLRADAADMAARTRIPPGVSVTVGTETEPLCRVPGQPFAWRSVVYANQVESVCIGIAPVVADD